jgi:hypothetical protein
MTMSPFERWSVWLTTTATLVTGVAYWWMKEMVTASDPWAVINHPLQPWALKAHILVAPLLVFSVGLITTRHVWRHFRAGVGQGRTSGLVAAASFILMVASGYALQVFTTEALLRGLGLMHLGLGIVYSLGIALHYPATRRRGRNGGGREDARAGTGEGFSLSASPLAPPGRGVRPPAAPAPRPGSRRTGSSAYP